jgi:phospholipid/cholesterol/gamma-HCH transport system substrate-binding protein
MSNNTRLAEVKLGAFVLTALVMLMGISLWIAGSRLLHGEQTYYYVLMKDSGGILAGDRVRIAGVQVGRIEQVTLRPQNAYRVALRVAIDRSIAIKTDSSAQVATEGLLGKSYLQIDPGSAGAPLLPAGQEIRGRESLDLQRALASLNEVATHAVPVLDRAGKLIDQVSSGFLSPENAAHLRQILASVQQLLKTSGPELSQLIAKLKSVSEKLDTAMTDAPEVVAKVSALASALQTALGPDGSRLVGVLDSAKGALDSAHDTLSIVNDNRPKLETTLSDLQKVAANFRVLSELLKERPYSLVRITPLPQRAPGQGVKETAQ